MAASRRSLVSRDTSSWMFQFLLRWLEPVWKIKKGTRSEKRICELMWLSSPQCVIPSAVFISVLVISNNWSGLWINWIKPIMCRFVIIASPIKKCFKINHKIYFFSFWKVDGSFLYSELKSDFEADFMMLTFLWRVVYLQFFGRLWFGNWPSRQGSTDACRNINSFGAIWT